MWIIYLVYVSLINSALCDNCVVRRETLLSKQNITGWHGYVPRCQPDGTWQQSQCHDETGTCWCVDFLTGEHILGTEGNKKPGTRDCESKCTLERAKQLKLVKFGIFQQHVPECEESGEYKPLQCYGQLNLCWCVDPMSGDVFRETQKIMTDSKAPVCPKQWTIDDEVWKRDHSGPAIDWEEYAIKQPIIQNNNDRRNLHNPIAPSMERTVEVTADKRNRLTAIHHEKRHHHQRPSKEITKRKSVEAIVAAKQIRTSGPTKLNKKSHAMINRKKKISAALAKALGAVKL